MSLVEFDFLTVNKFTYKIFDSNVVRTKKKL